MLVDFLQGSPRDYHGMRWNGQYNGKYVPCTATQHEVIVEGSDSHQQTLTNLHQLLFGGDQLTAAHVRGAIRQRQNSLTAMERLEGLLPVAEDWHAKLCLITVKVCVHCIHYSYRYSGIGFSKKVKVSRKEHYCN